MPEPNNGPKTNKVQFPYADHQDRLNRYSHNDKLFEAAHYMAFAEIARDNQFRTDYERLKYVVANFSGLISKVSSDMLFGEEVNIRMPDKSQQAFMDSLVHDNSLNTLFYESALESSRRGDSIFKLRVQGDQLKWETVNPSNYFPHLSTGDVTKADQHEIAWVTEISGRKYVRKEIHSPGLVENELWSFQDQQIGARVAWPAFFPDIKEQQLTGIDRSLVIHIPNYRDRSRFFGFDDYGDILTLQFALNNRLTKNENVLDKHSDPILAVPDGILDENGKVKREALHMFEISPSEDGGSPMMPEYITWNASLDNAFKQIDKLVEFLFMFSETSPDAFGMGQNGAASGRALKLRLMRTIAKVNRKRIYFDRAIKEAAYVAQLLAKTHNLSIMGQKVQGEPTLPEIEWQDGLPTDSYEAAQEEQLRVAAGNTSTVDSIIRLDHVDREAAEKTYERIKSETRVDPPSSSPVNFGG